VIAEEVLNQARALKETAELMIKAGSIGAVDATTLKTAEALVETAKQWRRDNPVIVALSVPSSITWPGILTIANAIYMMRQPRHATRLRDRPLAQKPRTITRAAARDI